MGGEGLGPLKFAMFRGFQSIYAILRVKNTPGQEKQNLFYGRIDSKKRSVGLQIFFYFLDFFSHFFAKIT